jgi:hypothetical protein
VGKNQLSPENVIGCLIPFSGGTTEQPIPTRDDFINGAKNAGFFVNQLIIPEPTDTEKVVRVNEFVYRVVVDKRISSNLYENNLSFSFMRSGLSLSNLFRTTDLGSINIGAKKGEFTSINQLIPNIKEYNPSLSDELINTFSIQTASPNSNFTKTITIQTSESYFSQKTVVVKALACNSDTLLVKFSFDDIVQGKATYTLPNADADG